ncbi:MAG: hypothetical protein R3C15_16150 [Thermoleophilia bacterium]
MLPPARVRVELEHRAPERRLVRIDGDAALERAVVRALAAAGVEAAG